MVTVPKILENKLAEDRVLHGSVYSTLASFEPWLRASGMAFFPGFTDHGEQHLDQVLITAASLISDKSRELTSPQDVGVLVLAVLLHDIGMHLTADGFRYLIDPSHQHKRIEQLDHASWQKLWAEFLSEASRWSGERLISIFGDADPVDVKAIDVHNLTERNHLLVGEFVRRHHCRLAHEIARWGVPPGVSQETKQGTNPKLQRIGLGATPEDFADLAGFVARSHGNDLRDSFAYLDKNYHLRDYKGVHAVYLMGVMRIADYLQIQDTRADQHVPAVKRLRSPLSQQEWKAHHAIRDIIHSHEDDPEALFVDAKPKDPFIYEKLTLLLASMQKELDSVWACFGEIYGRFPPLDKLGLTIRRLRSSLDEDNPPRSDPTFVSQPARFATADSGLLRLLVAPLYGNDPNIAIRELLQNAVDACKEREAWNLHIGTETKTSLNGVKVILDEDATGNRSITLTDDGVGMTEEIVRNYYLRAGASFRTSDAWRSRYEDADGKPRIHRGGRFGIGALAAFLISDKIQVTTRHVSEPEERALTFDTTLNGSPIALGYTQAPIGTTVKMLIQDADTWKKLNSDYEYLPATDWFWLEEPKILYIRQGTLHAQSRDKKFLTDCGQPLPPEWRRITHDDYDDVQWSPVPDYRQPKLTCNGLAVFESTNKQLWSKRRSPFEIRMPRISVFDSRALFPLNLQRTALASSKLPFKKELVAAVARDAVAFALASAEKLFAKNDRPTALDTRHMKHHLIQPAEGYSYRNQVLLFAMVTNGLTVFDRALFLELRPKRIWLLCDDYPRQVPDDVICLRINPNASRIDLIAGARTTFYPDERWSGINCLQIRRARFVTRVHNLSHLQQPGKLKREYVENLEIGQKKAGVTVIGLRNSTGTDNDDLLDVCTHFQGDDYAAEFELGEKIWEPDINFPVGEAWLECLGTPVLPFDPDKRAQVIQHAEQYLKVELEHYRAMGDLE